MDMENFDGDVCPNCRAEKMTRFYSVESVPVHSVHLIRARRSAVQFTRGDIVLGFCPRCSFISNTAFNPEAVEYITGYEGTQSFSSTFNIFHRRLARYLRERYKLTNATIIEIGCGQGEFLDLLCEKGANRGIGFDPAYSPERSPFGNVPYLDFIADEYSEKYSDYRADFVCCKMTLEHIPSPFGFLQTIRNAIGNHHNTRVFFQVPNAMKVLSDCAFWDIYYEHCSYFSTAALVRLFQLNDFHVLETWTDYDDQYIMLCARPGFQGSDPMNLPPGVPIPSAGELGRFSDAMRKKCDLWRKRLDAFTRAGKCTVLWGAGSKGVSFISTLNAENDIAFGIDVNPHKQGTYMPGSGIPIAVPDELPRIDPDTVIIMNPVYRIEVSRLLKKMNLNVEIITV